MMSLTTYAKAALSAARRGPRTADAPGHSIVQTHTLDPHSWGEFQRVTRGTVSSVVSPAYLHTLGFMPTLELMTDDAFPLPVLGMVHVYNRFEQLEPVDVGEQIDVETRIEPPRRHPRGAAVDAVITGRRGGTAVFEERTVMLAKGAQLDGAEDGAEIPRLDASGAGRPTAHWKLPVSTGREYAAVSGDRNPIHLSRLAAKAFGFPRTIAHGMYTAARALNALDVRADAYVWEVQFAKPLLLPSTVGFAAHEDGGAATTVVSRLRDGAPHVISTVTPSQG